MVIEDDINYDSNMRFLLAEEWELSCQIIWLCWYWYYCSSAIKNPVKTKFRRTLILVQTMYLILVKPIGWRKGEKNIVHYILKNLLGIHLKQVDCCVGLNAITIIYINKYSLHPMKNLRLKNFKYIIIKCGKWTYYL